MVSKAPRSAQQEEGGAGDSAREVRRRQRVLVLVIPVLDGDAGGFLVLPQQWLQLVPPFAPEGEDSQQHDTEIIAYNDVVEIEPGGLEPSSQIAETKPSPSSISSSASIVSAILRSAATSSSGGFA